VLGQKFDAPGGDKMMDPLNHHTWKPVLIGSIRADGQFDIIWKTPDWFIPIRSAPTCTRLTRSRS
jgi:hypothetical protein